MSTPKSGKYEVHWLTLHAEVKKFGSVAVVDLAESCGVDTDNKDFTHALEIVERQPGISVVMGKSKSGLRCRVLMVKKSEPTKRDRSNSDWPKLQS
jgi:hypothetical protein